MSPFETFLIVIAIIVVVVLVLVVILPYLKRKGVDIEALIAQVKQALAATGNTLDTIKPFLPGIVGVDAFDKILKSAAVGVGNAEKLYLIGNLPPERRKEEARKFIKDAVTLAGVVVTPEVERLIDGAIESEVLKLGHALKPADEPGGPLPVDA